MSRMFVVLLYVKNTPNRCTRMIRVICPTENEIADYLNGVSDDPIESRIEEHLVQCAECEERAIRLDASGDSLLRHLKLRPNQPPSDEKWLAFQTQLKDIPSRIQQSSPPSDAVSLKSALAPESLYHYQLGKQLGRGGMGVVYESWHPQLHRKVAIKILSAARAADTASIARFQREMRAAGNLDHPGIVRAVDAGVWQGTYYLVMEHVDGIDLSHLIQKFGPLNAAESIEVIYQAALALQHAHDNQVIHRDIKPSNLMLARDGTIKILDFGLARLEHSGLTNQDTTTAGRLVGTLDYLAPEQATGGTPIDARADIYGLGATLFKLLTGQPPHGPSRDQPIFQHLQRLTNSEPNKISEFRADVPPELQSFAEEMLRRTPDQRPSSAGLVATSLLDMSSRTDLAGLVEQAILQTEIQPDSSDLSDPQQARLDTAMHGPVADTEQVQPSPPLTTSVNGSKKATRFFVAIAMLMLGSLAGVAGLTLWINTGEGKIRIESEVEDVKLQLAKDGKTVDEISVTTGDTESAVRVGKYELRVAAGSDRVKISHSTIDLRRGEKQVVRIWKDKAEAAPSNDQAKRIADLQLQLSESLSRNKELQARLPAADDSFQGRRFDDWTRIMKSDKSPKMIASAIYSMGQLRKGSRGRDLYEVLGASASKIESFASKNPIDDYIVYLQGKNRTANQRKVYRDANAGWTEVIGTVASLLSERMNDPMSRVAIRDALTKNREPAALRLYVFAVAHSQAPKEFKEMIFREHLKQNVPAGVRAIAAYGLYGVLQAPADETMKNNLVWAGDSVHKAIALIRLDAKDYSFPTELGSATGHLIGKNVEDGSAGLQVIAIDVFNSPALYEEGFRGSDACLFLESLGASITESWQLPVPSDEKLPGTNSILLLAAVDAIMPAVRDDASRKLHQHLRFLLDRRDRLRGLKRAVVTPGILMTGRTITLLDGNPPMSFLAQPMQGGAQRDWLMFKRISADSPDFDSTNFESLRAYPTDVADYVLQQIVNHGEKAAPEQRVFFDRNNPADDQLLRHVPRWLAFSQIENWDNEKERLLLQKTLLDYQDSRSAYPANSKFSFGTGDIKRVLKIAQSHPEKIAQVLALNLASSLGAEDKVIAELLLPILNASVTDSSISSSTIEVGLRLLAKIDPECYELQVETLSSIIDTVSSRKTIPDQCQKSSVRENALVVAMNKSFSPDDLNLVSVVLGIAKDDKNTDSHLYGGTVNLKEYGVTGTAETGIACLRYLIEVPPRKDSPIRDRLRVLHSLAQRKATTNSASPLLYFANLDKAFKKLSK